MGNGKSGEIMSVRGRRGKREGRPTHSLTPDARAEGVWVHAQQVCLGWLARPFCTANIGGHGCGGFYGHDANFSCLDHTRVIHEPPSPNNRTARDSRGCSFVGKACYLWPCLWEDRGV